MGVLSQAEISSLFLGLLTAYQAKLSVLLGEESCNIISNDTIPLINDLIDDFAPQIANAKSVDDALKIYANILMESQQVGNVNIEKKNGKYIFNIDNCLFSNRLHPMSPLRNITCVWALFAIAIIERFTKKKIKVQPSEIKEKGSQTIIEFK